MRQAAMTIPYPSTIVRKINVANPSDRTWTDSSYIFAFGAYGSTYVLAYGDLDSALEAAAEWLADNAPGHITAHDSPGLIALWKEASEDAGLAWPMPDLVTLNPDESDAYYVAQDSATADLTYTESGYLTSYEWTIVRENPTPSEISAFARGH